MEVIDGDRFTFRSPTSPEENQSMLVRLKSATSHRNLSLLESYRTGVCFRGDILILRHRCRIKLVHRKVDVGDISTAFKVPAVITYWLRHEWRGEKKVCLLPASMKQDTGLVVPLPTSGRSRVRGITQLYKRNLKPDIRK